MANLRIGEKDYKIKFDYLAIRKFAKTQNVNKPSLVPAIFENMNLEDPSFDDIDIIANLVRSGIKAMVIPSFEDVLESVTGDPETIASVFEEFNKANESDESHEIVEEVKN